MSFISDIQGIRSCRPYPIDHERRRRVMIALAEKDMTISDLARAIGIKQSVASCVINGRRKSPVTEKKIAVFLKEKTDYLFPIISVKELNRLSKAKSNKRKVS